MALPKEQVTKGIIEELESFEDLVRSLTAEELATPSRCEGWSVGDVAAHVIGSMADVVAGRTDGLGSPEVTEREVQERRGRTGAELADELAGVRKQSADLLALFDDTAWLAPAPGGYDGTLGDGVEALWYDTFLHADDMRQALGRPTVEGPGLKAAISHVAFELQKRDWNDAMQFIRVATGRAEPSSLKLDASVNIYA
jgi:uncharacterized protein (TIGR03083 family)